MAICRKQIVVIQTTKNGFYKYFIDTKQEMTSEEYVNYQTDVGCPNEETIVLNKEQLNYINNN